MATSHDPDIVATERWHALADKGANLREQGHRFQEALGDTFGSAASYVTDAVRRQPAKTLGLAAGAGFVLGGGLGPTLGRSLVRYGARFVLHRVLGEVSERISSATEFAGQQKQDASKK